MAASSSPPSASPASLSTTLTTTATTTTSPSAADGRSLWSDPIGWLQSRIGCYDVAPDLEPLVQRSVLKGLKHIPKRSGRIKTELIDLDLVRGSPFPKPNTQFCWDAFSKKSLLRFLLFPLFFRWWRKHLSNSVWLFFLFLYSLFFLTLLFFFTDENLCCQDAVGVRTTTSTTSPPSSSSSSSSSSETFALTELLLPFALVMALAFIHTQIVTGARFSPDYRFSSSSSSTLDYPHHGVVASLGSPFLSSRGGGGGGGGGEHVAVNRRHRAGSTSSAGNNNNNNKRNGGGAGQSQPRHLTPVRDVFRGGGVAGADDDVEDEDDDEDVTALLNRCDVATLTQMDRQARVVPDPFQDGLRQRRPLPDDSGVEDSGAVVRSGVPEPSDAASPSAFGASRDVVTPDEAAAAAAAIPAAGAGDGARRPEEDSKDEENEPTRGSLHSESPPPPPPPPPPPHSHVVRDASTSPPAVVGPRCCGAGIYASAAAASSTSCCGGNAAPSGRSLDNPDSLHQPTCRDSSTSSDVGHQIPAVAPRTYRMLSNNRDSTASVTDEEAPNKSHLNHHHPHHLHHHLYHPHSPHYHNQIHFPTPTCSSCHHHLTGGHHRRNGVTPPRLGSCSPSRRFSDVKKQLLHKNNRQPKKSIALDAMTLSSNNSDEDSEDDAIMKSPSPRRNSHHPHHNLHGNGGVFGGRGHRTTSGGGGGAGGGGSAANADTTQWESDDGVGGETDDGDSDTSHALGATSLAAPSSPYTADDDDDADPLSGANPNNADAVNPALMGKIEGGMGQAATAVTQTRKSPPAAPNAGSQSAASQQGRISCRIWEGNEIKKAHLSVNDVSWIILEKVENLSFSSDYLVISLLFSLATAFFPLVFHLRSSLDSRGVGGGGAVGGGGGGAAAATAAEAAAAGAACSDPTSWDELFSVQVLAQILDGAFGRRWKERFLIISSTILRLLLSFLFLFLLSVAERTFKQRLLHAKYFCHLTSARRARASDLPHFRLNKVQNIKSWLSIRSSLKRRGPTRSVDIIVSVSFLVTCFLILFMCVEILKNPETFLDQLYNWEMMSWGLVMGFLMLRLITLGSKINKKYRNLSVLLTEQINLYLQMEQKPFKKEQFSLANNVLKLAAELLKELDTPFKISGIAANPLLYNVSRVVILSAFSGVLTEMLGFKLKLWKIKMK